MYSLVDLWTLTYSVIQFIIYKIKDILGTSIKLVYEKQNLFFSCFFYYVLNQWIFTSFFLYCCWIIPKVIYLTQFFVCDGTFQVALTVDFKCFNWHMYMRVVYALTVNQLYIFDNRNSSCLSIRAPQKKNNTSNVWHRRSWSPPTFIKLDISMIDFRFVVM